MFSKNGVTLKIANSKSIRFACLNFHYAKAVPSVQYGFDVFQNNEWCGVICYGAGATPNIAGPFNMVQGEVLELVRVALNGKQKYTSQCVAMSLEYLHKINPVVKIIVSYADLDQNHAGTIYQATNWIYLGNDNAGARGAFIINGKKIHPRSVGAMKGGVQSLQWVRDNLDPMATEFFTKGKHKYIYVFDKKTRKRWAQKAKPYPKNEIELSGENNGEKITNRSGE